MQQLTLFHGLPKTATRECRDSVKVSREAKPNHQIKRHFTSPNDSFHMSAFPIPSRRTCLVLWSFTNLVCPVWNLGYVKSKVCDATTYVIGARSFHFLIWPLGHCFCTKTGYCLLVFELMVLQQYVLVVFWCDWVRCHECLIMIRYYSMIMLRGYIYKLDMVFEGAITREVNFIVVTREWHGNRWRCIA